MVWLAMLPLQNIIAQLVLLQEMDLAMVRPFRQLSWLREVGVLMLAFNGLAAALKEYRKCTFFAFSLLLCVV